MSIHTAAQTGDEVATLEAMRDRLAKAMDEADPSVVAQLAGRLEAVLKRISELRPAGKVTLKDALAERRAARESAADTGSASTRKSKKPAS